MTFTVTLLVLSAAVMHATWNAFVKAGNDKAVMQCLVIFFGGIPGLIILPFVPLPDPACWPFLVGSVLAHSVYYFTLVEAYRFGALSQTYPIARGSAPLLIAIAGLMVANEHLNGGEPWSGRHRLRRADQPCRHSQGRRRPLDTLSPSPLRSGSPAIRCSMAWACALPPTASVTSPGCWRWR